MAPVVDEWVKTCDTPSGCLLGPNAGGIGVLASVNLLAGVSVFTPVIVLFRCFLGVVGVTWGVVLVFGAAW